MKKLIVFTALLFLSCSGIDDLAGPGGSSETQNGFTVIALLPDGKPAGDALVRVRPADYFAGTDESAGGELSIIDTVADDSGRLTIDCLENGNYSVEINDSHSCAGLFSFMTGIDSQLQTDTVTLRPYARVNGKTSSDDLYPGYVQVKGLERVTALSPDGSYFFDDLPEGSYTFRIVSENPQVSPLLIDGVSASSGRINVAGYDSSIAISLNTTVSGADVSEDVFSFPVLIRTGGQITLPKDAGICFTKLDGTFLPCQLEYREENGAAAIWVKIDTLKGNDTTVIYMHYEKGSSVNTTDNAEVFDADQFAGVWHLSEESGNEPGAYIDATSNARNGTGVNMESGRSSTGLIGLCQELNGTDEFIQIPGLLDSLPTLTISAWVNSSDSVGEIVSIGDNAGIRFSSDSNRIDFYSYYSISDETSWHPVSAGVETAASLWHHVAYVIDSNTGTVLLYVDGVLRTEAEMVNEILYNKVGVDTYIGQAFRESCNLHGQIDEVRVCSVARSSAWLKLCWENQRIDQKLVSFK